MVGQEICKVLEETKFPYAEFIPVATEKSLGKALSLNGNAHKIISVEKAIEMKPDIAIFSAGADTAKKYADKFAATGTYVIDNSSAFRMESNVPLIVPEVNLHEIKSGNKIIANPNCSTIQLVVALKPLYDAFGIKRIVISTYQSITGTGVKAVTQYQQELSGEEVNSAAYPHKIFENCLPHCDIFFENGYTKEELKLVNETRKIFNDPSIKITATAVRVPVMGGHSESVNVEFKKPFELEKVRALLNEASGVVLMDNVKENIYPMPLFSRNKNDVFVGRLRIDESQENTLNMWIVADNLRKGAATNAVQIAEYIAVKFLN